MINSNLKENIKDKNKCGKEHQDCYPENTGIKKWVEEMS